MGGEMTNDELRIRIAKPSDLDGIMNVETTAFLLGDRYSRDKISSQMSEEKRKYFVAEFEGRIVGYSAAAVQTPSYALMGDVSSVEKELMIDLSSLNYVGVLTSIGVLPKLKGQGIGQKLLEIRLNWLAEKGVKYVFTHAWPNGGFPRLGEKNGFKRIKEWDGNRTYSDGSKSILFFKQIQ